MPELPDIEDYRAALSARVVGARLQRARIAGISLLKTYDPPITAVEGLVCTEVRRLGKRLVWRLEPEPGDGDEQPAGPARGEAEVEPLFLVLHLMIAGRLHWREHGAAVPRKRGLAAFDFSRPDDRDADGGTLLLTEAGTHKRASLHVERGEAALAAHDRGGLEPLEASLEDFADRLRAESRTLKRALTDPRRFSGIGNAFSDEILHAAGLSPVQLTTNLSEDEVARLHAATQQVLGQWVARLRAQTGEGFPEKVTAFREDFAVHGRYGQPCPVCGTPVQRIRYADNETDYCPVCQTDGRVLADRSLSRLLKDDWPRTVDELEGA